MRKCGRKLRQLAGIPEGEADGGEPVLLAIRPLGEAGGGAEPGQLVRSCSSLAAGQRSWSHAHPPRPVLTRSATLPVCWARGQPDGEESAATGEAGLKREAKAGDGEDRQDLRVGGKQTQTSGQAQGSMVRVRTPRMGIRTLSHSPASPACCSPGSPALSPPPPRSRIYTVALSTAHLPTLAPPAP